MTLLELSAVYQESASTIHGRITELRAMERDQADPEAAFRLHRRILDLIPLWQEARDLAVLTAHYYDRSYHKHEKYAL